MYIREVIKSSHRHPVVLSHLEIKLLIYLPELLRVKKLNICAGFMALKYLRPNFLSKNLRSLVINCIRWFKGVPVRLARIFFSLNFTAIFNHALICSTRLGDAKVH